MPLYVKPNGKELEIHENSVEYAESLGWKPVKKTPPKKEKSKEE